MFVPATFLLNSVVVHDYLMVALQTSTTEALSLMSQGHKSYVLVLEAERLVGIFTERDVVKLTAKGEPWADRAIASVMTTPVITLPESQANDVLEILALLRKHRIRHLPIVDAQERVMGVVTRQSIRESLKPAALLKARQIHEVMVSSVITAPVTASILHLSQLMHQQQVSCIVLVQPESSTLGSAVPVGVLTERDIVQLQAQGWDLALT